MLAKLMELTPKIYTSEDHHIRNDLINPHALSVLRRLHEAGFTAYLVGGGVRDLLLRREPKDFDISTSARPEEVRKLFRNSILIGRRFPLAHIRFGKEVIEVATFRAGDPADEELIVRDTTWGTPDEDAFRRDFTINGLFYDPLDHRIIDYVGGFEDIQAHLLRCIGSPKVRFKQDPVRMIRMQKFRARFGFHVAPEDLNALEECYVEISKSSPARVLEELFRMLESGAAESFFRLLYESKLLEALFPKLDIYLKGGGEPHFFSYMQAVDALNRSLRPRILDRAILSAACVFPLLEEEIAKRNAEKPLHLGHIMEVTEEVMDLLLLGGFAHFPRKIRHDATFLLVMQYRLTPLGKKRSASHKIIHHECFIPALTFLKLRALHDHSLFKVYQQWKHLYQKEQEAQEETEE